MPHRLALQALLEELLGSRNVYFQPPASITMKYPCIVYSRSAPTVLHASNLLYFREEQYQLTVIDSDPDSAIVGQVALLPKCRYDRHFAKDNLNHDIFNISY